MKIYVAGHRGLVGSAIVRAIESGGKHTWIGKTRSELDLLDRKAVFEYVAQEKPDALLIAAAKVGGIHANDTYPVQFLTENLQIESRDFSSLALPAFIQNLPSSQSKKSTYSPVS